MLIFIMSQPAPFFAVSVVAVPFRFGDVLICGAQAQIMSGCTDPE